MVRVLAVALVWAVGLAAGNVSAQQQMADPDYRPHVDAPAFSDPAPRVLVDESHGSAQTIDGRYAGFAALARADGLDVRAGKLPLDAPGALDGVDVLVVSNPRRREDDPSAFTPGEIEAVEIWVRQGGSLLLAADHAPHGAAAESLAAAFGVNMGKGYAFRLLPDRLMTNIEFSGELLGSHAILRGRTGDRPVARVATFTGQSLDGPPGSTVLLSLGDGAREAPDLDTFRTLSGRVGDGESLETVVAELSRPALPAQAIAFQHGAGRVVVLGEAGMLTAQMIRYDDGSPPDRFGLQTEGNDDELFALNILRWLAGALP